MLFSKNQHVLLNHKNGLIWFRTAEKITVLSLRQLVFTTRKAFTTIKRFLADKQVLGGDFNYAKYSSKMPDLLTGQSQMSFQDRFAGGALMDLGIYPSVLCCSSFGKVSGATYHAQQLVNSVDPKWRYGILFYPDYQVHIKAGKNITSMFPFLRFIQQMGSWLSGTIEHIRSSLFFHDHQGSQVQLPINGLLIRWYLGSRCICPYGPATRCWISTKLVCYAC